MNEELKTHLAKLIYELGDYINYKHEIYIDSSKNKYANIREHHELWVNGYELIQRPLIKQIMEITAQDFVRIK